MTTTTAEMINSLPFELANIIYSFVGKNPVAELVDNHFEELRNDFDYDIGLCEYCGHYDAEHYELSNREGRTLKMCEYCYAEELGTDVYTCEDCGEKTYEYGRHINTINGLYCSGCMHGRDEDGELVWE